MRASRSLALITGTIAALALAGCTAEQPPRADETPLPPSTAPASAAPTPTTPTPTTTPDPYAGYFDEEARENQTDYPAQFWGSFGDVGGVGGVRNENQVLPAGTYSVEISCVGADQVTAELEALDGTPLIEPAVLLCPANSTLPDVELTEPGIVIILDSDGQTGAHLTRIAQAD